jgi:hypothetical protein
MSVRAIHNYKTFNGYAGDELDNGARRTKQPSPWFTCFHRMRVPAVNVRKSAAHMARQSVAVKGVIYRYTVAWTVA